MRSSVLLVGDGITEGSVTNMCPSRAADPAKADAARTEGTEIEVKPSKTCLTDTLQVSVIHVCVYVCL